MQVIANVFYRNKRVEGSLTTPITEEYVKYVDRLLKGHPYYVKVAPIIAFLLTYHDVHPMQDHYETIDV